jgi:hypothetical protein
VVGSTARPYKIRVHVISWSLLIIGASRGSFTMGHSKLLVTAIFEPNPSVRQVLRAFGWCVIEMLQGFGNVARYGNINSSSLVIPIEGEPKV